MSWLLPKIRMLLISVFAFLTLVIGVSNVALADWGSARPDGHAPIGVMGEHTHDEGESMLSYRYMLMDMDGNRDGSARVSTESVLADFPVSPTDMEMEMHMLGLMYAPRDWLTLVAMLPLVDLSMNHVTRSGRRFRTHSSGLGDIKLGGLIRVLDSETHRIHLNSGLSLPSGEIDERGDIPVMDDAKLPYPMQLGSGTVDLMPGVTYLGQSESLSWGAQGIGTIRLGHNDNGYSLGNRFDSSVWGAIKFCDYVSSSLRATWGIQQDIDGSDPELNPMMVPTADPDLRGGQQSDIGVGLNFFVPEGEWKSFRVAIEYLFPVYRELDGPQLEMDWTLISGVQMSF